MTDVLPYALDTLKSNIEDYVDETEDIQDVPQEPLDENVEEIQDAPQEPIEEIVEEIQDAPQEPEEEIVETFLEPIKHTEMNNDEPIEQQPPPYDEHGNYEFANEEETQDTHEQTLLSRLFSLCRYISKKSILKKT
jgi:gas vesicle protein